MAALPLLGRSFAVDCARAGKRVKQNPMQPRERSELVKNQAVNDTLVAGCLAWRFMG
jgi:hypothetical protein